MSFGKCNRCGHNLELVIGEKYQDGFGFECLNRCNTEQVKKVNCWNCQHDDCVERLPENDDHPYGHFCSICKHSLRDHPYYGEGNLGDLALKYSC